LQAIGCLACRIMGHAGGQPSDCHHLLSGNKRRGDRFTIPLCPYHHRGVWHDRFGSLRAAEALLGPSLALQSKRFREAFGSDDALLSMANGLMSERENTVNVASQRKIDSNGHLVPLINDPWARSQPKPSK
jgi:hypothetical protein